MCDLRFSTATMNIMVLLDVTTCSLAETHISKEPPASKFRGEELQTWEIKPNVSPKMFTYFYKTTWCHT
jgi:hypothetical protein